MSSVVVLRRNCSTACWRSSLCTSVVFALWLACLRATFQMTAVAGSMALPAHTEPFRISNDTFLRNGKAHQVIAGSAHYFRMHPYHWEDRLKKVQGLGCNTLQTYVPWNFHETEPGVFDFESPWRDLEAYLKLAQRLGMDVMLRPGPYICAEWEFGGLPAWLLDPSVTGSNDISLRTNDPIYMSFVTRFWDELLPRIKPLLAHNGGPVIAVQIENEYGFMPPFDADYLRALIAIARRHLGDDVVLYTTDPPFVIDRGTLPGDEVYSVVDFGPGYDSKSAFAKMAAMNAPGHSPPMNSEFYIGWLSHWGELIAEKGVDLAATTLRNMLRANGGLGSVSFYMAFGGTNFGFWAGANRGQAEPYQGDITSYDYDCPINENGALGRPGSAANGLTKYDVLRSVVFEHNRGSVPPKEPVAKAADYGTAYLTEVASLLEALPDLSTAPGGVLTESPLPMEHYHQWYGLILYRTHVPVSYFRASGKHRLSALVHDDGLLLINGNTAAILSRNQSPHTSFQVPHRWLRYPADDLGEAEGGGSAARAIDWDAGTVVVDILVQNMGRDNFCKSPDHKGVIGDVLLNGRRLTGWSAFPLPLHNVRDAPFRKLPGGVLAVGQRALRAVFSTAATVEDAVEGAVDAMRSRDGDDEGECPTDYSRHGNSQLRHRALSQNRDKGSAEPLVDHTLDMPSSRTADSHRDSASAEPLEVRIIEGHRQLAHGPVFFRGHFTVTPDQLDDNGVPRDTYISAMGFGKGIAWINDFNLGRYWPEKGPQINLYVPGPLLHPGENEIILLEMHFVPSSHPTVLFDTVPNFEGPKAHGWWARLRLWWRKKMRSFSEWLTPVKNRLLAWYAASPLARGGGFGQNVN